MRVRVVSDRTLAYMLDKQNGANLLTIHTGHYAHVVAYCLGEFRELSATLATQRLGFNAILTFRLRNDLSINFY